MRIGRLLGQRTDVAVQEPSSGPGRGPRAGRGESPSLAQDASEAAKLPLLVLASTFPKGRGDSTPAFVLNLSKRLQSRFQVMVLAPAVKGAPDRDEIEGVEVRRFHYFWPRSLELLADGAILENLRRRRWLLLLAPFLLLFEFIAAYRWARTSRPAVIHAHWFIPQGLVAVMAGRLLRIPVVITSHGGDVAGLRGWPWSIIRKMVARRSDAVTVVSSDLRDRLGAELSPAERPLAVMPMGVDTERFELASEETLPAEKTVLFVGRLAEKKGLQHLLRAFPDVLDSHPDARLVVVGDGPMRGELERLADALALGERVEFVGAQPSAEIAGWYRKGRLFVLPSVVARSGDSEGLPVVLLEAMAAGRPIVASSVGGVTDIVVPGRTGLLVEPESPQALAEAIKQLLRSPATASRMGGLSRRWIRRRFDWRRVGAGYTALLAQVAGVQTVDLQTQGEVG